MLTLGTVCTGIGGFDVGFERQGFRTLWQIENDKACKRVLRKRFPHSRIYDDLTEDYELDWVNILAGGTPCQGFSYAGLREGLADFRSNLALRFCVLANRIDPDFIVWENVPGVLSMPDNAFGCFLGALVGEDTPLLHPKSGWFARWWNTTKKGHAFPRWPDAGVVVGPRRTAAWRVLDSQFFGVAQRRERVLVIASPHTRKRPLGDKRIPIEGDFFAMAAKVLFESEGVRRHSPPSREKAEDIANTLGSSPEGSGPRTDYERMTFVPTKDPHPALDTTYRDKEGSDQWINNGAALIQVPTHEVSTCLQERGDKGADSDCIQAYAIVHGFDKGRGEHTGEELAGTLRCNEGKRKGVNSGKADNQCAFMIHSQNSEAMKKAGPGKAGEVADVARALDTNGGFASGQGGNVIATPYQVRRLTPVECERIQGFEDDWTRWGIEENGVEVEQKDSPRYRQLGNAVTTEVGEFLAKRIKRHGY